MKKYYITSLLFLVTSVLQGQISLYEQTEALKYQNLGGVSSVPSIVVSNVKSFRLLPSPRTTYIGLVALDVASTCWAIHEGFTELNPLLGGRHATCERVALTNAALMGVSLYLMRELPDETAYWTRTKNKLWRRTNIVRGLIVVWNIYQTSEAQ